MPDEIENPNPTDAPATPPAKKPAARAPKLKIDGPTPVKPQVEGINTSKISVTPAVKPNPKLTDQEKKLLNDDDIIPETSIKSSPSPKLMPQSVIERETHKGGHGKEVVIAIIILLLLGMGGYEAYLWHQDKQAEAPAANQTQTTTNDYQAAPAAMDNASTTPSSTPDTAIAPTSTTPTVVNQVKINSTPTGYLNVRSTASSSGKLVTQVHPGETYTYTQKSGGWYQITLTDGTSGWVSGQYVTETNPK